MANDQDPLHTIVVFQPFDSLVEPYQVSSMRGIVGFHVPIFSKVKIRYSSPHVDFTLLRYM
jgi:hypothetical protein